MKDLFGDEEKNPYEVPESYRLARRDGPDTSKKAAHKIAPKLKGNRALCWEVMKRLGRATQKELDAAEPDRGPNPDYRRLAKRANELVAVGKARVVGERDGQQIYEAID